MVLKLSETSVTKLQWDTKVAGWVKTISKKWRIVVGDPFSPPGQCSWVAPATTLDGTSVVLKLSWLHLENRDEAKALKYWDGSSAIELLDFESLAEDTSALLLERCDPGRSLSLEPDDIRDDVICQILPNLWIEASPDMGLQPLESMCRLWCEGVRRRGLNHQGLATLAPELVEQGLQMFVDLAIDSPGPEVVLATDLHAQNVLSSKRSPWLAIDPKPYIGDRTYVAIFD